jgi:viroplasmin and RNaseH domain-containing protein
MPPSRKKRKVPKWYAVRRGRQPGVYETWEETERQVCSLRATEELAD